MVTPNPDVEAKRRLLLSLLAQKQGFHPPPQPRAQEPPPPPPKQRSGFMQAAGNILGPVFSGSKFADALLPGNPGTDVKNWVSENVPVIGRPLAEVADSILSPFTVATLGYGGIAGTALRGANAVKATGGFSKFLAPVVEPLVQGSLKARLGAEVGMQVGARGLSEVAEQSGLPEPVQLAAGAAGGLLGLRTAANVAKYSTRTTGGLLPEEVEAKLASGDSVDKLTGLLSGAKRQNVELAAERSAELGRRKASIDLSESMNPEERYASIRRGMKGELPTREFEIDQTIAPEDIKAIHEKVSNHFGVTGRTFEEARAYDALTKIWGGQIPQMNEIKLLSEALGSDFGMVLSNLAEGPSKWKMAMELAGVPRAVMSSFDASMPLRQGIMGLTRKSYYNSWRPMIRAFHDPKYADDIAEQIATDPHPMSVYMRDKGTITAAPGKMQALEEAYTSSLAETIPGVRQSERGALTFNNKFRNDYGKNLYDSIKAKLEANGESMSDGIMDDIDLWTGIISGRGRLPKQEATRKAVQLANTFFFSPKFLSSRLQALNPMTYARMHPEVRKEAMRDMMGFWASGMSAVTALGIAGKAGLIDVQVELDPRSSDFGKIRTGQTRVDMWGGFQPIARYMAQFITGQSKNSSGDINDRARATTGMNFVRGKAAPVPSFLIDALTGQSFTGQEVDVATGRGLDRAAAERLVPLFAQDMADAFNVGGYTSAALAVPALFGMGVQSYNSAAAIKQAGAEEMFGKPWAKLNGEQRAAVEDGYKEQLAQQSAPAPGSITAYVERVDDDIHQREQELAKALGTQIGNKEFTDNMNSLMSERANLIRGAVDSAGIPDSKDPALLDRYFGLREQATLNGVVDYEKLDQLQHDFMQTIPAEDQEIILKRTRFKHMPEVQWWADAKKTVGDSDYYRQQQAALEMLSPMVQKLAPGVTTYRELQQAAFSADTPAQSLMLRNVIKRVDAVTRTRQKVYRLQNPEVDEALGLLYGSKSVLLR